MKIIHFLSRRLRGTSGLRGLIAVMVASLLVSGCSGLKVGNVDVGALSSAVARLDGMTDKSQEEEQAIGDQVALTLLQDARIDPRDHVQRYVNQVGQWIVAQSERPDLQWRFIVLDDPGFNAFAAPAGYVFITRGLLDALESEAELAAVLAHEAAHVLRKHHLEAIKTDATLGLLTDIGQVALSAREDNRGGAADSPLTRQLQSEKFIKSVQGLYTRGLDRSDEIDADRIGLILTARAGYDPYALLKVLQKIDSRHADKNVFAVFASRHPPAGDRIAAVTPLYERADLNRDHFRDLPERYRTNLK